MNATQAKQLCRDFNFNTRTRKCKWIMSDGQMCKLATHFDCELLVHIQREKDAAAKRSTISVSQSNAVIDCERRFFFDRVAKVPWNPIYFAVGRAFARCSAQIDLGLEWELDPDVDALGEQDHLAKLDATLQSYELWRADNPGHEIVRTQWVPEQRGELELPDGTTIRGYFDRMNTDGTVIVEWKYSGLSYTHLRIRRQVSTYLAMLPDCKRVIFAVAKKPQHRMKPGEKYEAFVERLLADFAKKGLDKRFEFKAWSRREFDIPGEIGLIEHAIERRKHIIAEGVFPPNYSACDKCSFNSYCNRHTHWPNCKGECGFEWCDGAREAYIAQRKERDTK